MKFDTRIFELEIMDQAELSSTELKSAYRDINRSNYLLGGYRATYNSLLRLSLKQPGKILNLIDVGCGEGGMLRYLAKRFQQKGYEFKFYGLDLNRQSIELAKENSKDYPEIDFCHGDILDPGLELPRCDYVISTLTMHHIENEKIVDFISQCSHYADKAVVINDLQRSKLAYYLFKIFSAIFIKSPIAQNDGLLSIRKGFGKNELEAFSKKILEFEHLIEWKWAFRYVWVMQRRRLNKQ